jgi:hypothetical protein
MTDTKRIKKRVFLSALTRELESAFGADSVSLTSFDAPDEYWVDVRANFPAEKADWERISAVVEAHDALGALAASELARASKRATRKANLAGMIDSVSDELLQDILQELLKRIKALEKEGV